MLNLLKKPFFFATTLLIITSLAACGRTAPVQEYKEQPVPTNVTSADQVKQAIIRAGSSLGWIISEAGEGKLKGTLNIRAHQAMISIPYNEKSYSLLYLGSVNLKYDSEDKTIHNNYNGWLMNLNNNIQSQLAAINLQ